MSPSRRAILAGLGLAVGAGLGGLIRRDSAGGSDAEALLRPPGALDEAEFLASCIRCGQCVEACPPEYNTLQLVRDRAGISFGSPFVNSRNTPCHLCANYAGLLCIDACPTAALSPVADTASVRMGTAVIDHSRCLAYNRVICRACWHACPFPDDAIRFDSMLRPVVVEEACVGCGLCDHACPTEVSSIPIRPASTERET
jgi:MauM/NapG family ferredoxin protein